MLNFKYSTYLYYLPMLEFNALVIDDHLSIIELGTQIFNNMI